MKPIFYMLMGFIFMTGCIHQETPGLDINDLRSDFAKGAEISNAKTNAWEKQINDLYADAKTNPAAAIKKTDDIIKTDTSLDKFDIAELYFIKGDIYYHEADYQKALGQFSGSLKAAGIDAPKYLAARAGAYIKLKEFDKAHDDLNKAAEVNYDYDWNIGNYYEIIGKKDSAASYYHKLYEHDTIFYKSCMDRIIELNNPETKLFTELIFTDRDRKMLTWKAAN